jgi:signal transduction histidine kinase
MSVKSKKPLRKVIRSFPGGFALFLSVIAISLIGILTAILVYSHFNYKNSQKKLFIEKWDSIAGRISRDASLAISDAGLIDDDFASYLYWIPAVPIYATGSSGEDDSLIDKFAPNALSGDNQFIFPEDSGILHTIIASPVYIDHKIEAVLLLTVDDSPEKIGIKAAVFKPVMLAGILIILWTAILLLMLSRLRVRVRIQEADRIQILQSSLANPGSEKSKTIIEKGLKEIIETFSMKEGSIYIKNPLSGDFKREAYNSSEGNNKPDRKSDDIDPGDPCLQSITYNKSIIYDKVTKQPVPLEDIKRMENKIGISLPLTAHSVVTGVLSLTLGEKKRFDSNELLMLKQTVEIFSISLFRAAAMEEKTSDGKGLLYILDLIKTVSSTDSYQTVLGLISEKIASTPGVTFCSLFTVDESNKSLYLVAEAFSGEGSSRKPDDIIIDIDEMPIHKVALMSGQSQVLHFDEIGKLELEKHNLLNPRMKDCTIQIVPLIAGNRRIGCLSIGTVESEEIPYGKKDFFDNIAYYLSSIINTILHYSEIKTALEQLRSTYDKKLRLAKLEAISDLANGISKNLDDTLQLFLDDIENLRVLKDDGSLSDIIKSINDHMNTYRFILDKFKGFSIASTSDKLHQIELAQVLKTAEARIHDSSKDGLVIPENIRIEFKNSGSGQILGNEYELYRAVFNIVLNAVEAMPYGGDITVESRIEGNMALLEISDHGSGMNEGELRRIFEPFFTTKKGMARGLGLSIAHKIVVIHNGDLDAESDPGKGTRFIIRIPLIDPEQTALYSARKKKSTDGIPLSK